YIGSPLNQLFDTGKRVRQRLDRLPADAHLAFAELVPDGYIDYLAMPVYFGEVLGCGLIVVTKKATGFSKADIEGFRLLRTYLAPVLEVYALRYQMHSLLDTYVGRRTGEKILSGMVKRGDADSIFSALWFSDLREFTHLSEILSTDKMLTLLNQYFEIVSASVTAQGGEILRFIGDAMLIVFPIDEKVTRKQACQAAINAALDAQSTLATLNHQRRRHGEPEIHFGVGLNIGEVIYGNVGALDRLDFTVMGRAVNRTARFESLTKTLDRNILFSREFAELIDAPTCFMGEHQLKGIANPQAVYALQPQAVNDIPEESGANH
ncbi:MAG: adenylate cyclase, partial [Gammaproteobacteria bacterium]